MSAPDPTAPTPDPGAEPGMLVLGGPAPAAEPPLPQQPCLDCGEGTYGPDGYCGTCGARARDPHDHEEHAPTDWLAGVCDRGIRHETNEDALALAAGPDGPRGRRAAIVVCDGVSTAAQSALASERAARAALDVLTGSTSTGVAPMASALVGALSARLDAAADAADAAVAELTHEIGGSAATEEAGLRFASNPSCTFVAAVLDGDVAVVGSVGDSRAYWFPDAGAPRRLTTDDSWAEEQIRLGADREQAEAGPQSHTITRWIGVDAPDHTPGKSVLEVTEPGWLLVCSDGLWNYASEPESLAGVLAGARDAAEPGTPLDLARRLVEWANAQGGRDNITVGLLRAEPGLAAGEPGADTREQATSAEAGDELPVEASATEPLAPRASAPASAPTTIITTIPGDAGDQQTEGGDRA